MSEQETSGKASGKGRPTPSRKQQEAAHKRPLIGERTPEARKAAKAAAAEERRKARVGMASGEEKYLPMRDRGAQKKFVRDFIDSRFTIGEIVLPFMFLVILISGLNDKIVQLAVLVSMWVVMFAVAINAFILGRMVSKRLAEKYGEEKVEAGVKWYAAMRSIQMRPMRMPKPQVKRGFKL
ncbi:DUF3043 domain-containing protein [Rhodoluna sp.]|uniref:DUF3043 domain-containing protein n=1 Tax=Rhodoluna sp. TaxID=1969481 RepID=UPI0025D15278|nr:DUF3043 domain-containing protein [Rhodoluna sp.]